MSPENTVPLVPSEKVTVQRAPVLDVDRIGLDERALLRLQSRRHVPTSQVTFETAMRSPRALASTCFK